MLRLNPRSRSTGFTIIELLVVMLIAGVVSAALYQMLYAGRRSHEIQKYQVEMQQNARSAITSITDDFRHVSYGKDPTQPSIKFAGSDSIVYIADIYPDIPGAEEISYYLSHGGDADTPNPNDTILMKTVADSAGHVIYSQPQSYGIVQNGLHLRYYNGAGTELGSPVSQPELIGQMMCEVSAAAPKKWKQDPYSTMILSSTVYPRNLPLTPGRSRPSTPVCSAPTYPSCSSVTLTWERPTTNTDGTELLLTDISCFNLYYGTDRTHLDLYARLDRTVLSWTVTGLGCDNYWVSLTCVSTSGVESFPAETQVSAQTGITPTAPASLAASDSSGVKLEWSAVTQFTDGTTITSPIEYEVFRSTTSGFTTGDENRIGSVAGPATRFHDDASNDCNTYYYLVRAKVCCSEGAPSPEAPIDRPPPPQCPTNFAGTSGAVAGTLTLTWTNPALREDLSALPLSEISATQVYWDTLQNNTVRYTTLEGNETTLDLTGLDGCKTYYIHGRTVDTCGHASSSNCLAYEVPIRMTQPCDDNPPVAPANLTLTAGDQRIDLVWPTNKVDCDLESYKIYYGSATGNYNGTGASQGPSPIVVDPERVMHGDLCTYSLTGLDGCVTLYVAVSGVDRCSPPHEGEKSPERSAMTTCTPCGMSASCASWITTQAGENRDMHLEVFTGSGADETLAKLVPTYSGTAKALQVWYGRPLALIWKSDGSAGQDGNVGPQGSGATLNVTDVTVSSWTSSVDGIPLKLVFDSDVRDLAFNIKFRNPHGDACTVDGTNRGGSLLDDFDDGNYSGWTNRSGTWTVNGGELYQSNNGSNRMMVGYNQPGDLTLESKIKITSGATAYLVFRYIDDNNFYMLGIQSSTGTVRLARMRAGTPTTTGTSVTPINNNVWYNLKAVVSGTRVRAYLNCAQVLDVTDTNMAPSGQIGFRTSSTNARWDDVRCQPAAILP